jgi:hypothetical protein
MGGAGAFQTNNKKKAGKPWACSWQGSDGAAGIRAPREGSYEFRSDRDQWRTTKGRRTIIRQTQLIPNCLAWAKRPLYERNNKPMKPILDRSGKVLGFTHECGDRREIRSRSNSLVAWYDKRQDKTFKRDGSLAGFGDQAIRFLDGQ